MLSKYASFVSIKVENCTFEDTNFSPLITTTIAFDITQRTTDYQTKDFLFTNSNSGLYKQLIALREKTYFVIFSMIESNDISSTRYFFHGNGLFVIGFNSSYNVFTTSSSNYNNYNFLQLVIDTTWTSEVDYYQGTFTNNVIWLRSRNFSITDSKINSQALYAQPQSPWNALRQYFPNLTTVPMTIKVYPSLF